MSVARCVLLLVCALLSLYGCAAPKVEPPFLPSDGITNHLVGKVDGEKTPTGEGFTLIEWDLSGTPEQIEAATSASRVRDKLVWSGINSDSRVTNSLNYIQRFKDFAPKRSMLAGLWADDDSRAALVQYEQRAEHGVVLCAFWLCSPKQRKLIFIGAKG